MSTPEGCLAICSKNFGLSRVVRESNCPGDGCGGPGGGFGGPGGGVFSAPVAVVNCH